MYAYDISCLAIGFLNQKTSVISVVFSLEFGEGSRVCWSWRGGTDKNDGQMN